MYIEKGYLLHFVMSMDQKEYNGIVMRLALLVVFAEGAVHATVRAPAGRCAKESRTDGL